MDLSAGDDGTIDLPLFRRHVTGGSAISHIHRPSGAYSVAEARPPGAMALPAAAASASSPFLVDDHPSMASTTSSHTLGSAGATGGMVSARIAAR